MKRFNLLDIATADMAFEAFGSNLNELFANAAIAMEEIMTDTTKVQQKTKISFDVKSEDLKALLFDFLSEILFYKDSQYLVFSKFIVSIKKIEDGYVLHCDMFGEKWDRDKHEVRTEVKAVTYNSMEIAEKNGRFRAQVVLDT